MTYSDERPARLRRPVVRSRPVGGRPVDGVGVHVRDAAARLPGFTAAELSLELRRRGVRVDTAAVRAELEASR